MKLLNIAINSTENDYIDFKQEWYSQDSRKFDMVHDILCLANSLSNQRERYIYIGIKENSHTKEKDFKDVSQDKNILKAEDIITILSNSMSVIPKIEVKREQYDETTFIDIIVITPEFRNLPYCLNREIKKSKPKNQTFQYEAKIIHEYQIYSRNCGKNTNKPKQCAMPIVEELFARKRGEHLPIMERFNLYLDDIDNWKRPKNYTNVNITEDNCYYLKNHKFKIIIQENNDIYKIEKLNSYREFVFNIGLNENYWKYRNQIGHSCYDDIYSWFNVELWADNTLVETVRIINLYIKYYFSDKKIPCPSTVYIPMLEDLEYLYKISTKEQIEESTVWKVCQILSQYDIETADGKFASARNKNILNHLNYEYLANPMHYIDKNENWIDDEPINKR